MMPTRPSWSISLPQFGPTPHAHKRVLVDNPARLYDFD